MTYTDLFGNPIVVGDTIAYPTCSGSSAAETNLGVVTEILDLIPRDPSDLKNAKAYLQSDLKKATPPTRYIAMKFIPAKVQDSTTMWFKGTYERDDSKAYYLRITKTRDGYSDRRKISMQSVMIKNVDRIIVVTSLI